MILFRWAVALLFFTVSLFCVRFQVSSNLHLNLEEAFAAGLGTGMVRDLGYVFLGLGISFCFSGLRVPIWVSWGFFLAIVFLTHALNASYHQLTGQTLELWILESFFQNQTPSEMLDSLQAFWLLLGVFSFAGGLAFSFPIARPNLKPSFLFSIGVALISTGLLIRQSPVWMNWVNYNSFSGNFRSTALADEPILNWMDTALGHRKSKREVLARQFQTIGRNHPHHPLQVLENYRGLNPSLDTKKIDPSLPLISYFEVPKDRTEHHRRRLGLPEIGPLNIILFTVEGLRAYELQHPELAPRVFPKLNQLLKTNGILFTQAYSSAHSIGRSVRGQFSGLCSFFPNMTGAAVFLEDADLPLKCLPELFSQAGFQTFWFSGFHQQDQNTASFLSSHGVTHFFDIHHFSQKQGAPQVGESSIRDEGVFKGAIEMLIQKDREGKDFFAQIHGLNARPPHSIFPGFELDEETKRLAVNDSSYLRYLSRLKTLDQALTEGIQKVFESPLGTRTLIVLMGTHGLSLHPNPYRSVMKKQEMQFRIPLVFFTQNMSSPERLFHPVHQIDLAPTLSAILGLSSNVPWLGRDLFLGGSPWIYFSGRTLSYRNQNTACYSEIGAMNCFEVKPSEDPLFQEKFPEKKAPSQEASFFRQLGEAIHQTFTLKLLPRGF